MASNVWADIVGHEPLVESLAAQVSQGHVSHAYLFVGPRGIGKKKVALALGGALNCASGGCGVCSSCRAASAGRHVAITVMTPEGGEIRIDDILVLRRSQVLRQAHGHHVYIIDDAHLMNREAANAFLKTLEEPGPNASFVLLTDRQDLLLDTIISRCTLQRFSRLRLTSIERLLIEKFSFSAEQAALFGRLSAGRPSEALALATLPEMLKIRDFALDLLKALPTALAQQLQSKAGDFAKLVDSLAKVFKEHQDTEAAANLPDDLELSKKAQKDNKRRQQRGLHHLMQKCYDELLKYMVLLIRDSLLIKSGAPEELLVNVDMRGEFPLPLLDGGVEVLSTVLREVETARARLYANVSPQLCLEALLFSLKEEFFRQCQKLSA